MVGFHMSFTMVFTQNNFVDAVAQIPKAMMQLTHVCFVLTRW